MLANFNNSYDGGCLKASPSLPLDCNCNANPWVSTYAGCWSNGTPAYFNDLNDMPNGICIMYKDG
jgi:hypothetical protein